MLFIMKKVIFPSDVFFLVELSLFLSMCERLFLLLIVTGSKMTKIGVFLVKYISPECFSAEGFFKHHAVLFVMNTIFGLPQHYSEDKFKMNSF